MPSYDRPESSEHAPYYGTYIAGAPEGELLAVLEWQSEELQRFFEAVSEEKGSFAYAPGKWTLKEVIGHVTDTERVFSYRALRIGRGDQTPLPGFDQNAWVPNAGASARTLADLLAEFHAVRAATVALLRHLPSEAPTRRGTVNDMPATVRALGWIIAGHAAHHLRIIRERYLP